MTSLKIYFLPIVDEQTGELVYSFEYISQPHVVSAFIVVMPKEFSIQLDIEDESVHPSKIVKMTLYDILQTYPVLEKAERIIIYHELELDRAGLELDGIISRFWGAHSTPDGQDHVLDSIHISREFFHWLKFFGTEIYDNELKDALLKYHQKEGLVDFDLEDDLHDIIIQQIIKERRKVLKKRKKVRDSVSRVRFSMEKYYEQKAAKYWEKLMVGGKLLYYKPGERPPV